MIWHFDPEIYQQEKVMISFFGLEWKISWFVEK